MNRQAINIAKNFLHNEGIPETREELWRRWDSWNKHMSFTDPEIAATALILGDYDVESAYNLPEIKNFYFNGGLAS